VGQDSGVRVIGGYQEKFPAGATTAKGLGVYALESCPGGHAYQQQVRQFPLCGTKERGHKVSK